MIEGDQIEMILKTTNNPLASNILMGEYWGFESLIKRGNRMEYFMKVGGFPASKEAAIPLLAEAPSEG